VSLNLDGIQLRAGDAKVELNTTEFALLHVPMDNAGRILSSDQIIGAAWGDVKRVHSRILNENLRRVRSKLREVGASEKLIRTVRGAGYVFDVIEPPARAPLGRIPPAAIPERHSAAQTARAPPARSAEPFQMFSSSRTPSSRSPRSRTGSPTHAS
jgi:DNA-binding winged helix-turn-helix (wHTH) protein